MGNFLQSILAGVDIEQGRQRQAEQVRQFDITQQFRQDESERENFFRQAQLERLEKQFEFEKSQAQTEEQERRAERNFRRQVLAASGDARVVRPDEDTSNRVVFDVDGQKFTLNTPAEKAKQTFDIEQGFIKEQLTEFLGSELGQELQKENPNLAKGIAAAIGKPPAMQQAIIQGFSGDQPSNLQEGITRILTDDSLTPQERQKQIRPLINAAKELNEARRQTDPDQFINTAASSIVGAIVAQGGNLPENLDPTDQITLARGIINQRYANLPQQVRDQILGVVSTNIGRAFPTQQPGLFTPDGQLNPAAIGGGRTTQRIPGIGDVPVPTPGPTTPVPTPGPQGANRPGLNSGAAQSAIIRQVQQGSDNTLKEIVEEWKGQGLSTEQIEGLILEIAPDFLIQPRSAGGVTQQDIVQDMIEANIQRDRDISRVVGPLIAVPKAAQKGIEAAEGIEGATERVRSRLDEVRQRERAARARRNERRRQ